MDKNIFVVDFVKNSKDLGPRVYNLRLLTDIPTVVLRG